MTHVSRDAIQHLKSSAERMKMIDSHLDRDNHSDRNSHSDRDSQSDRENVSKINECETCALFKAHRIISRSSDIAETSDKSFYRITYDLMQLSSALSRDEWVSHFACYVIDFNLIFTHVKKFDASRIIRETINLIETRFNEAKVVFIRSDEKKSLKSDFRNFLIEKKISFESFASNSSKQNDHSERKKEILAMKTRVMRIDARLLMHI
jgi:hypothetical protein